MEKGRGEGIATAAQISNTCVPTLYGTCEIAENFDLGDEASQPKRLDNRDQANP